MAASDELDPARLTFTCLNYTLYASENAEELLCPFPYLPTSEDQPWLHGDEIMVRRGIAGSPEMVKASETFLTPPSSSDTSSDQSRLCRHPYPCRVLRRGGGSP